MSEFFELFMRGDDSTGLSFEGVLLHLLMAFVLSQLIAWIYAWTHSGLSYSRATVHSMVLLSVIVTLVMLAVGNNLARAFGLFGALALVRFRTPVKDPRDTAFLFISVGIGISVGSRNLALAIAGTLFLSALSLYLHYTRVGARAGHDGLLRFSAEPGEEVTDALRRVLRQYCSRFSLVHLRESGIGEALEHAYQVQLVGPEYSHGLTVEMRAVPGIQNVSLLMQDRDAEV